MPFRRTSSLAAHPTAQGVSLRGIGPSGVSRTLVLLDGVPFNDPFGGWVYWTRVPLDATDRIEIVDSASSSLYGNYAMGGVINVMTAAAMRRTVDVKAQYGIAAARSGFPPATSGARSGSCSTARRIRPTLSTCGGHQPAGLAERGRVDKNASVEFRTFNLKAEYAASRQRAGVRPGGHFRRGAHQGKPAPSTAPTRKNDTS